MVTVSRTNGISIKGMMQLDRIVDFHTTGLEAAVLSRRSMSPFIHAFGRDTSTRFNMETSPTGRSWQALSEMTEEKREERGYSPSRPILEQSGQLRQAASGAFLRWGATTGRATRKFNAPYGNHHSVSMNATNQGGRFHAQISGARVANQYGGKIRKPDGWRGPSRGRQQHLPARPFWGITQEMIQDGMNSFRWILPDEWRKQARGLHVT